ncbi:MAG TPA: TonB-dependent receptor [Pyrinomonadaceae bacterium]|nr:TonB-dependent receptor [Pyrinomonadaceae bacterium]
MLKTLAQGLLCFTLTICAANICFAQSAGNIKGTVADSAGALVAGATVEAVNDNTGEKRTTTSADNGTYSLTNLPVGIYTVTATATGFEAGAAKEVKVSVAFTTEVPLVLAVAGTTANVVITAGDVQTQLNTNDQQLSTLLDNKKIIDLPLLNRDPNALVLLAPGTVQTNSALGGFSVNGSRERNNNFLVDGIDNNDTEVPGIPGGLATPNIDATQEFRVITNNFTAEYGRNSGAIIATATKGGTNDFHGNAYIYYRSDAFAARNFFDITGHADPLQRKQFGGSIGGPIIKDKLFFFTNYEGDRFNIGTQNVRIVPSASARLGILNTGPGLFGTVDLRSISANNPFGFTFNPAIQQLLNLYPLGNSPNDDLIPGVFQGFRFAFTEKNKVDTNATRVDYRFNDNHSLKASYNFSQGDFSTGLDETFPGFGDEVRSPQRGQVFALSLTSNFGSTIVNEARFGVNRAKAKFNGPGDGTSNNTIGNAVAAAFKQFGYPAALPFGGSNGENVNLSTTALQDLSSFDTQFRFSGTWVVGDDLTWIHNSHTFRTGFERRWIYSNGANNFSRSELLNFDLPTIFGFPILVDNGGNDIPATGLGGAVNDYASFLYGLVGQQFQSQFFNKTQSRVDQDYRGFRGRELDLYFQDSWKVKPNFTLNLGLRYEYKGSPYEVNGQLSTLVDQDASRPEPAGGFRFALVGNKSGSSQDLYEADKNNFGPRFGFAWSPDYDKGFIKKLTGGPGKMAIRGGYGIFYDRVFGNLFGNARGNPPFQQDFNSFPATGNFPDDALLQNVQRPPNQISSLIVGSNAEIFPVIFALPGNNIFQSKYANPYEQKWNFGFQRELGNQFLLEADYVGAKGTNELRVIDGQLTSVPRCNALFPTVCGAARISTSAGTNLQNGRANDAFFQTALNLSVGFSTYNAGQFRITKTLTNKRFGTGQIQGAYTWSHSIDNAADPLVAQGGERNFPRDSSGFAGGFAKGERGNSGFDARHRFVLNFLYDIPLKFERPNVDRFLGNWEVSGIWTVQSGNPFSAFSGNDSAGTGFSQYADFGNGTNNLTPGTLDDPRTVTGPDRSIFSNPCPADAVTQPNQTCVGARTIGRQGATGRNAFVGPGFNTMNFSVLKRIPITEQFKLRLQADFFNLFNRVNFGSPVNTINSLNFGHSTTIRGTARVIQFALRLDF